MQTDTGRYLVRGCGVFLLFLLLISSPSLVSHVSAQTNSPVYTVQNVTTIKEPGGRVSWSHAGNNLIAFDKLEQEHEERSEGYYDIYTMLADGTNEICVTCGGPKSWSQKPQGHMWQPAWHPSGSIIGFQAEMEQHPGPSSWAAPPNGIYTNIWAMTSDGSSYLRLTDIPAVSDKGSTGTLHPVFSHDGTMLSWSERLGPGDTWGEYVLKVADFNVSVDATGELQGGLENIRTYQLKSPAFHESHDFSPDDTKILFAANLEQGQDATEMDIYSLDITTDPPALTNLTRRESDDWWEELPTYSPDGTKILYTSSSGYTFDPANWFDTLRTEYWLMNPDGSDKVRLTYFNEPGYVETSGKRTIASDQSWGPDGTKIAALLAENGGAQDTTRIVIIDIEQASPAVNVALTTDQAQYVSGTDTTATLTAVVTDESGTAISGLPFGSFSTAVDGASVTVNWSETATAGTYSGALNLAGLTAATHEVRVSVTDTRGIDGSATTSLSIISQSVGVALNTDKATYQTGVDTSAVLTAIVTDELGNPISDLDSSAFVTTLDSNPATVTFGQTAAGTYEGSLNISTLGVGSHSVSVTVTDSRTLSGSDSATFTLESAPAEPTTVSVVSITYSPSGGRNGDKHLAITVALTNDFGEPVSDTSVTIDLSHESSLYSTATGTTGTDGTVTFNESNVPSGCYQTTVTDISTSLTWDGATPGNQYCK